VVSFPKRQAVLLRMLNRLRPRGRVEVLRNEPSMRDPLLSPHQLLQQIGEFCVSHGLVRVFPAGTRLYRVRKEPAGKRLHTPLELGPPPAESSRLPTRMSSAGIPMFNQVNVLLMTSR
jgi:hypothetical protein